MIHMCDMRYIIMSQRFGKISGARIMPKIFLGIGNVKWKGMKIMRIMRGGIVRLKVWMILRNFLGISGGKLEHLYLIKSDTNYQLEKNSCELLAAEFQWLRCLISRGVLQTKLFIIFSCQTNQTSIKCHSKVEQISDIATTYPERDWL